MRREILIRSVKHLVLSVVTALLLITVGCRGEDWEEQVAILSEQQTRIERERDSLQRVLAQRNVTVAQLEAAKGALDEEVKALEGRTTTLSTTAASRSAQLRVANEQKAEVEKARQVEAEKSAALDNEVRVLRERIETLNREATVSERERERIVREAAAAAVAEEERRVADSVKVARMETTAIAPRRSQYVNTTELTGGFGLGDTDPDFTRSIIGVTNVFGYAFSEKFSGGVGTGIYLYNGGAMVPLYLDFRYRFPGITYQPLIVANGGMLFNLSDFGSSGAYINPSIGVERQLNRRSALHMTVGPLIQHAPSSFRSTFIVVRGGFTLRAR